MNKHLHIGRQLGNLFGFALFVYLAMVFFHRGQHVLAALEFTVAMIWLSDFFKDHFYI